MGYLWIRLDPRNSKTWTQNFFSRGFQVRTFCFIVAQLNQGSYKNDRGINGSGLMGAYFCFLTPMKSFSSMKNFSFKMKSFSFLMKNFSLMKYFSFPMRNFSLMKSFSSELKNFSFPMKNFSFPMKNFSYPMKIFPSMTY